ncbi:MAG: alpha/beta hydrolase [Clostridia bacterium]|nr:alpha/beta hydrolase [Clostridia bacterium]
MECFKIDLKSDKGMQPELYCYIPANYPDLDANRKRPAVIVCPGGAYRICSNREAECVALQYVAQDMAAFVLYYSVKNESAAFPRCTMEALTAIKTVRENSENWNIDPNKIAILGFSAGGHLAASTGIFWNADFSKDAFGNCELCKPNAAILCYPVISDDEHPHLGSFRHLLGNDASKKEMDRLSIEKHVTADYPPTFLWHTATDTTVPVQNSIVMAKMLADHGVPFELHIYPTGRHGLSLADERSAPHPEGIVSPTHVEERPRQWVADSISFLKDIAFKSE